MISVVRVDHRLVHGQVIYSWVGGSKIDTIFVVNDDVAVNELRKKTIRLAKPAGVKLVMKSVQEAIELINSGITDNYQMMIVLENVNDAYLLITNTHGKIKSLNLGGTKMTSETEQYFNQIHLTKNDVSQLSELVVEGVEVEARMVPSEEKKFFNQK